MSKSLKATFANEAALCAAFIAALPEGWTAYPETAGFDIILLRAIDGAQIGVEAKMTLNAKVLLQAVEGMFSTREAGWGAPDFRAALVPFGCAGDDMKGLARRLGVTVIECKAPDVEDPEVERLVSHGWTREGARRQIMRDYKPFVPELPHHGKGFRWREDWVDHCPSERCKLPDYVPDVAAGASGPSSLSEWKVKAIKLSILLERQGYVTISDFKHLQLDRSRWLQMRWLEHTEVRGRYVVGPRPIDLRAYHPVNYLQIEQDFEKWRPPMVAEAQPELL